MILTNSSPKPSKCLIFIKATKRLFTLLNTSALISVPKTTYRVWLMHRKAGVKCLVHCKMGVSRSASTVIAYAMKEYGWDLDRAYEHVKERRTVTKPNPSFMKQLEEYQGILLARYKQTNK